MNQIIILDIPFDTVDKYEALNRIMAFAKSEDIKGKIVATPNPEMLLAARRDTQFREILNRTDLNIADGTGILWAAAYLDKVKNVKSRALKIFIGLKELILITFNPSRSKKILPERVTGTDMVELICKNIENKYPVFLLGGAADTAEKTASLLNKKYSTRIAGTNNGSAEADQDEEIVRHINACSPVFLFVAFGAPRQEMWLNRNLGKLKTVKVAMGVGGAFDFISGNIKRAPLLMRNLGLEWLYRLIKQPSRIKRIFNATIIFPIKIIKSSF